MQKGLRKEYNEEGSSEGIQELSFNLQRRGTGVSKDKVGNVTYELWWW